MLESLSIFVDGKLGDFYVGGDLYVQDDIFYDEISGNNINITGVGTIASSARVSDLTDNRVVISGYWW